MGGNTPGKQMKLDFNYKRQSLFTRYSQFDAYESHGSTPFYMAFESGDEGYAHGVYVQNANAMEVETHPAPGMVFRTVGGIIDLYRMLVSDGSL